MIELEERLARGEVVILDGGTGTELERRGVPMDEVAWCGASVMGHGETLRQVHADYIRAGAEVIITNTFATSRIMLEPAGLGDEVTAINRRSVEIALRARDEAGADQRVWVAGSVSPMAPRADPSRRPDLATYAAAFREQAAVLAENGVELIVLEMMRDVEHTRAAIEAAAATGLPVWVGFSCEIDAEGVVRGFLGLGERPFAEIVEPAMATGGSLLAVMHGDVEVAAPALEVARAHWSGPLGAYPHSGHFEMPHWQFDAVISPEAYLKEAEGWVAQGARLIGGCCGIGPEHIRLLAERLPRQR